MKTDWIVNLEEARAVLEVGIGPDRASFAMRRGSMRIGLYAPITADLQTPHSQDEVYLVLRGGSTIMVGSDSRACKPGDVIFVAAGVEHRFTDFSDDLELCVIFWGPEGGDYRSA